MQNKGGNIAKNEDKEFKQEENINDTRWRIQDGWT